MSSSSCFHAEGSARGHGRSAHERADGRLDLHPALQCLVVGHASSVGYGSAARRRRAIGSPAAPGASDCRHGVHRSVVGSPEVGGDRLVERCRGPGPVRSAATTAGRARAACEAGPSGGSGCRRDRARRRAGPGEPACPRPAARRSCPGWAGSAGWPAGPRRPPSGNGSPAGTRPSSRRGAVARTVVVRAADAHERTERPREAGAGPGGQGEARRPFASRAVLREPEDPEVVDIGHATP